LEVRNLCTYSFADRCPNTSPNYCAILRLCLFISPTSGDIHVHSLIVEDNAVNALLLEPFLKKDGYRTLVSKNALVALATLSSTHDIQLMITDL